MRVFVQKVVLKTYISLSGKKKHNYIVHHEATPDMNHPSHLGIRVIAGETISPFAPVVNATPGMNLSLLPQAPEQGKQVGMTFRLQVFPIHSYPRERQRKKKRKTT